MKTALVLGGTGQIGIPAVRRLAEDGWEVTVAARHEPAGETAGFRFVRVDRAAPGELEAAADGVDLLVDIVPFTPADGQQLVSLAGHVGSVIAISSAAVYGFGSEREPLPVPIPESHSTVAPGDDGYAARKRAIEAMLEAGAPRATLIRAGAVYGPHTRHSREWYFVKRVLDRRPAIILARRGASRFHTISVDNLAELIALAAAKPATRVLNAGDPRPPTVLEIARAISATMQHRWEEVLLAGPEQGTLGDHPWNTETPFVLDMSAAERQLGYQPVTDYRHAVPATVAWLEEATRSSPWRDVLTESRYLETMFDYEAEDAFLRRRSGGL